MDSFIVTFPDEQTKQYSAPVVARDLLCHFKNNKKIIGMRINNELCALSKTIAMRARVSPIELGTYEGSNMYRRTLCFLLVAATKALYPDIHVRIGHSLGYSYYYTYENAENKKIDLEKIAEKMRDLISENLYIEPKWISYEQALEMFKDSNQPDSCRLLSYHNKPRILINTLGSFHDLSFQPLMDRTRDVSVFNLIAYEDGFLLQFPSTAQPEVLQPFEKISQLFTVYKEYKDWGKLIGISSVGQLNEFIENRKYKDYIEITETLQNNKIAKIANDITAKGTVKVILIAGPSSSGKTTTAKKLSMQLRVLGYDPKIISLDDYYRGAENTPKNEKGEPDFECLEALDVPYLNEVLLRLFAGEEVEMPSYNFKLSTRQESGKTLKLNDHSILILEGIHGLNNDLTPKIDESLKFKIYLSALTQLNLDDHNRIPTSDNRLIRRIVRDSHFRGSSAVKTIKMWAAVRSGERKHIFPHQDKADVMFNTALDYELAVLKVYAEPLLRAVKPTEREYGEASRLLIFLNNFLPLPTSYVPGQSILREFIGNSEFSY